MELKSKMAQHGITLKFKTPPNVNIQKFQQWFEVDFLKKAFKASKNFLSESVVKNLSTYYFSNQNLEFIIENLEIKVLTSKTKRASNVALRSHSPIQTRSQSQTRSQYDNLYSITVWIPDEWNLTGYYICHSIEKWIHSRHIKFLYPCLEAIIKPRQFVILGNQIGCLFKNPLSDQMILNGQTLKGSYIQFPELITKINREYVLFKEIPLKIQNLLKKDCLCPLCKNKKILETELLLNKSIKNTVKNKFESAINSPTNHFILVLEADLFPLVYEVNKKGKFIKGFTAQLETLPKSVSQKGFIKQFRSKLKYLNKSMGNSFKSRDEALACVKSWFSNKKLN